MEENPKVASTGWIVSMEYTHLPICEFSWTLKSNLIALAIGEPVVYVLQGLAEKGRINYQEILPKAPSSRSRIVIPPWPESEVRGLSPNKRA